DVLAVVAEQLPQPGLAGAARDVQCPQGPQLARAVALLVKELAQFDVDDLHVLPRGGPFLEAAPRGADVPVVLVALEPDQVAVGEVVAEVDQAAGVRMTAPALAMLALAVARGVPGLARVPVLVVGVQADQAIKAGVEVLAVHALVVGAGDDVPEVAVDVVGE